MFRKAACHDFEVFSHVFHSLKVFERSGFVSLSISVTFADSFVKV